MCPPVVHDGSDYGGEISDPPASDANGYSRARLYTICKALLRELADRFSSDIRKSAIREMLPDEQKTRESQHYPYIPP